MLPYGNGMSNQPRREDGVRPDPRCLKLGSSRSSAHKESETPWTDEDCHFSLLPLSPYLRPAGYACLLHDIMHACSSDPTHRPSCQEMSCKHSPPAAIRRTKGWNGRRKVAAKFFAPSSLECLRIQASLNDASGWNMSSRNVQKPDFALPLIASLFRNKTVVAFVCRRCDGDH